MAGFPERKIYTVSEITRVIKVIVERGLPEVCVMGEISAVSSMKSGLGHIYFTLRDADSLLKCAMFRSENEKLSFELKTGMKIEARGRIAVYMGGGYHQLVCQEISPLGTGLLQIRLEELKTKLAAEGFFDDARKRPLPEFPERVGIVTSAGGAVIKDIEKILAQRWPGIEMILAPVRVQGEGAAFEIAKAIGEFNRYAGVDLLIVGRGGGSPEDLWAFNEEPVARAIYSSRLPVISAVGHESDVTISDLVADARASTPSAAAKMAVKDKSRVFKDLCDLETGLRRNLLSLVENLKVKLDRLRKSHGLMRPVDIFEQRARKLDDLARALRMAASRLVIEERKNIDAVSRRLTALSPREVLRRGYCVTRAEPSGAIVKRVGAIAGGQSVEIEFFDGRAGCDVLTTVNTREDI